MIRMAVFDMAGTTVNENNLVYKTVRKASCRFSIGITTGAHTFAQLQSASPDFILNNLKELLPVIGNAN
jgi:hypothetical protein